jgi:hypothetical protein
LNYLAALGLESWQSHYALPGAKVEIAASVMQFFDQDRPVLRVIYPQSKSPAVETLLTQFWRAIEIVGNCQGRAVVFKQSVEANDEPVLILGEDLAKSIYPSARVYCGVDPVAVCAAPSHKADWWQLVIDLLLHNRIS